MRCCRWGWSNMHMCSLQCGMCEHSQAPPLQQPHLGFSLPSWPRVCLTSRFNLSKLFCISLTDYGPELGNVPLIFGELMTHERCSSLIQEMFQYTLILSSFPKHLISRVPTEYWRCLVPIEEAVAVTGAAEAVLVPAGSLECDRKDPHQTSLTHTLAHGRLHSS